MSRSKIKLKNSIYPALPICIVLSAATKGWEIPPLKSIIAAPVPGCLFAQIIFT